MAESRRLKVLVAVDGSKHSDHAVGWYLDNLYNPNHHCIFMHIVAPFAPTYAGAGYMIPPAVSQAYVEEVNQALVNARRNVEKLLQPNHAKVSREFIHDSGDAGHQICHAAKERHVNMVVIGTRGLGSIRRTILGSVSDYVLHHAHVPVTVVHGPSTK